MVVYGVSRAGLWSKKSAAEAIATKSPSVLTDVGSGKVILGPWHVFD